jgi:hypothetical protein
VAAVTRLTLDRVSVNKHGGGTVAVLVPSGERFISDLKDY